MKFKLYKCFKHWNKFDAIWIFSDPHFDDPDCKLMHKDWPSSEEQVKLINSKVSKKDMIIFLGDLSNEKWIKKIKGYKVLITGNHDKGATTYERKVETIRVPFKLTPEEQKEREAIEISYGPIYGPGDYYGLVAKQQKYTDQIAVKLYKEITKDWQDFSYLMTNIDHSVWYDYDKETDTWYITIRKDNQLFDEVYDGPVFINDKILLSHEPIKLPFGMQVHGHCHGKEHSIYTAGKSVSINVCADVINFEPVRLDKLVEKYKVIDLHRVTIDAADKKECPVKDLNAKFCKKECND